MALLGPRWAVGVGERHMLWSLWGRGAGRWGFGGQLAHLFEQLRLFLWAEGVEARQELRIGAGVVGGAITAPLLHVSHLSAHHPEEIGARPTQHDNHEERGGRQSGGKPFKATHLEPPITCSTQGQDPQANQQGLATGQPPTSPWPAMRRLKKGAKRIRPGKKRNTNP